MNGAKLELTLRKGPRAGESVSVTGDTVSIGRDPACGISLDDPRVSRHHAQITRDESDAWLLRDLQSTNATLLNGKPVNSAILKDGDRIRIGVTEIVVSNASFPSTHGIRAGLELATDPVSIELALRANRHSSADRSRFQEALFRIGLLVEPASDPLHFLENALAVVQSCVPHGAWAWIDWPQGAGNDPRVRGAAGVTRGLQGRWREQYQFIDKAMTRRTGVTGTHVALPAHAAEPEVADSSGRHFAAIPMERGDAARAVLYVERDEPAFERDELEQLAALATRIHADLENLSLYQRLQAAFDHLNRSQAELVRTEKLAAIGRLASSFAHDLNNPLGSIIGFLELALRAAHSVPSETLPGKLVPYLERANAAAGYCRALSKNLLAYARQKPSTERRSEPFDVREAIEAAVNFWGSNLRKKGIELEVQIPGGLLLHGDPCTLQQVVMNLVTNAEDALAEMPAPHEPRISIEAAPSGTGVRLAIRDNGPGIPAEIRDRIFEPLFTTKKENRGTGLGLYVVKRIVQESGGALQLDSEAGRGTCFTIELPSRISNLGASEAEDTLIDIPLEEPGVRRA